MDITYYQEFVLEMYLGKLEGDVALKYPIPER